jgi:hypothetical protein
MLLSVPTPTLVRCPVPLTLASGRQSIPVPGRGSTGQCHRISGDTILSEFPAILSMTLAYRQGMPADRWHHCSPTIPLPAVYVQPQGRCAVLLEVDRHPRTGYGKTLGGPWRHILATGGRGRARVEWSITCRLIY